MTESSKKYTVTPVSYTHLDVYKRQYTSSSLNIVKNHQYYYMQLFNIPVWISINYVVDFVFQTSIRFAVVIIISQLLEVLQS